MAPFKWEPGRQGSRLCTILGGQPPCAGGIFQLGRSLALPKSREDVAVRGVRIGGRSRLLQLEHPRRPGPSDSNIPG